MDLSIEELAEKIKVILLNPDLSKEDREEGELLLFAYDALSK